ncbi:MAG: hypothetical protein CEE42_05185 [Promethearchaeota archaeon Loki_b31]|nr:MAG: hypothetical protein CEE42_05185 [Candidatus Lokiarchaeota archaeon Loki_b31]
MTKLVKWWRNTPKKFTKLEKIIQIGCWVIWSVRVSVFTIGKNKKEVKVACCLSNVSYRKIRSNLV